MTPQQLHALQHSLGCDEYGRGTRYRNRYVCDAGDPTIDSLVALGFMRDHGAWKLTGGMHYYSVTPEGVAAMERESPAPPKVSRSRQRYLDFLNADSGLSFREWLGIRRSP